MWRSPGSAVMRDATTNTRATSSSSLDASVRTPSRHRAGRAESPVSGSCPRSRSSTCPKPHRPGARLGVAARHGRLLGSKRPSAGRGVVVESFASVPPDLSPVFAFSLSRRSASAARRAESAPVRRACERLRPHDREGHSLIWTTTLPRLCPESTRAWASAMRSKGKTLSSTGRKRPASAHWQRSSMSSRRSVLTPAVTR